MNLGSILHTLLVSSVSGRGGWRCGRGLSRIARDLHARSLHVTSRLVQCLVVHHRRTEARRTQGLPSLQTEFVAILIQHDPSIPFALWAGGYLRRKETLARVYGQAKKKNNTGFERKIIWHKSLSSNRRFRRFLSASSLENALI